MSTEKIKLIPVSFIIILALFLLNSKIQAQQPIDMISCGDNEVKIIVSGEELTIMGLEGKGINMDNLPSKIYDNMTYHGACPPPPSPSPIKGGGDNLLISKKI